MIYSIIFKNIILFFIFFLLDITWWEAFGSWNLMVLWRHLYWQTTIMTNFFKINIRIQSYKLLLTYFPFGSSCVLIPLFSLSSSSNQIMHIKVLWRMLEKGSVFGMKAFTFFFGYKINKKLCNLIIVFMWLFYVCLFLD